METIATIESDKGTVTDALIEFARQFCKAWGYDKHNARMVKRGETIVILKAEPCTKQ